MKEYIYKLRNGKIHSYLEDMKNKQRTYFSDICWCVRWQLSYLFYCPVNNSGKRISYDQKKKKKRLSCLLLQQVSHWVKRDKFIMKYKKHMCLYLLDCFKWHNLCSYLLVSTKLHLRMGMDEAGGISEGQV